MSQFDGCHKDKRGCKRSSRWSLVFERFLKAQKDYQGLPVFICEYHCCYRRHHGSGEAEAVSYGSVWRNNKPLPDYGFLSVSATTILAVKWQEVWETGKS